MKRLVSLLAIIGIFFASNCSRIPENNDPILGIWSIETPSESSKTNLIVKQEWIFNDAYLGRFHEYNGSNIVVENDFKWSQESGTYTITYPSMGKNPITVSLENTLEDTVLQDTNGTIIAIRE